MPLTPEQREAYDGECEELRGQGLMTLRDATKVLDMHDTYVRTMVRKGALASIKDSRGRIWLAQAVVDAKMEGQLQRRENAALRKAGKLPKYQATYVPAAVRGLRGSITEVQGSTFDDETKEKVIFVLSELLEVHIAKWEAKKTAKAAEEEAEEAEE